MKTMKDTNKNEIKKGIRIKIDYSKLPNQFHFEQVLKGGKVHKDKSKVIPRKNKYKEEVYDDEL